MPCCASKRADGDGIGDVAGVEPDSRSQTDAAATKALPWPCCFEQRSRHAAVAQRKFGEFDERGGIVGAAMRVAQQDRVGRARSRCAARPRATSAALLVADVAGLDRPFQPCE